MKPINEKNRRVIKTARDLESINAAIREGYRAVVRKVEPSPEIRNHFRLISEGETGEIIQQFDMREEYRGNGFSEVVLNWTSYYPYSFPSPFAAYLIPPDLKLGQTVWLEDLIEDYVGFRGAQGEAYRLESCEAIWLGGELEIKYDPSLNRQYVVG
jgi:hypothetical protein